MTCSESCIELSLRAPYWTKYVDFSYSLRWFRYSRIGRGFHLELIHSLTGGRVYKMIAVVGRHISISFFHFGT